MYLGISMVGFRVTNYALSRVIIYHGYLHRLSVNSRPYMHG